MKNHSNSSVVRSMFDPSEVTMISLAVEAPFLILTTLTVLYVVFLDLMKHKKLLHSDTLENSMFWLYALYIIAILVTVLRIPIRPTGVHYYHLQLGDNPDDCCFCVSSVATLPQR
jgi:hypothetical protein